MLASLRSFAATLAGRRIDVEYLFTDSGAPGSEDPLCLARELGTGSVMHDAQSAFAVAVTSNALKTLVVVTGSVMLVGLLRRLVIETPFSALVTDPEGRR